MVPSKVNQSEYREKREEGEEREERKEYQLLHKAADSKPSTILQVSVKRLTQKGKED